MGGGSESPAHGSDLPRLISLMAPMRLMTAASAPAGWALGAMAAWAVHVAGTGIVLTAVSGFAGWRPDWLAAAAASGVAVAGAAATLVLLADEALQFTQEAMAADVLAREPVQLADR